QAHPSGQRRARGAVERAGASRSGDTRPDRRAGARALGHSRDYRAARTIASGRQRVASRATRRGAPREAWGSTGNCESTPEADNSLVRISLNVEEAEARATRRGAPREAWGYDAAGRSRAPARIARGCDPGGGKAG